MISAQLSIKKLCGQEDLDDWAVFPAIVKPVDNQGQRGVFRANCMDEARHGAREFP